MKGNFGTGRARQKEKRREKDTHTHTHTHTHIENKHYQAKGYRRYKVKYDAKTERTANMRVEISLKYIIQDDFEYINYNTLN